MPSWPTTAEIPLGDGRHAAAIERPESIDALRDAVNRSAALGLAVYPQGGRTSLDYGGVPRRPGVAIDMTRMARVIDYPAADMTITVEAGITLDALSSILVAQGQRLEIDAPRPDVATVGGVLATNSTGPRRFGWGRPRDHLLGVSFVTAAGDVVKGGGRVVKNVAGYDLPRLLIGSMGTLGVIASATFKVRPRPEAAAVAWVRHETLATVAADLDRLNTSSTRPVMLELIEAQDGWMLAVGFEGNAAGVEWQVDRIAAEVSGVIERVDLGAETESGFQRLRETTPAMRGEFAFAANLRPSKLVEFVAAVDRGRWAISAHAGSGVVRTVSRSDDLAAIEADVKQLRALADASGGNLILQRCPTARKERMQVWGSPRADWAWCERIKAALDPTGVMNPGRFVGTI